ncbi:uncharacterized protein LOC117317588 [Pecten maximus]|uniref:uncharacterized protein LOC117317588 n=1 Tax=Pecten maximus TaxID=6579 RepID=UPI001458E600|nr:uncharacterized protein LOC117317588 [Pecten maximus]
MGESVTIFVLALVLVVCHGHSLHFKSLIHDVVPEIKEKVAENLKHLEVKLPGSVSGLRIPVNKEDLNKLKPALKEIKEKLPKDLKRLDSNLQDSVLGLSDKAEDIGEKLQPILKALEKEVLKSLKLKGIKQGCGCKRNLCTCCVHLEVDKIKLNDTACAAVAYLPKDIGVQFTLSLDGKTLVNKSLSVTNPPAVCVGIPHLKNDASICIKFTKLAVDKANRRLSGCMSVIVKLKFIDIDEVKIGCFKIPFEGNVKGGQLGIGTSKTGTQMSKEDQLKMLSQLGLMGKTFNNGHLINQKLLNN